LVAFLLLLEEMSLDFISKYHLIKLQNSIVMKGRRVPPHNRETLFNCGGGRAPPGKQWSLHPWGVSICGDVQSQPDLVLGHQLAGLDQPSSGGPCWPQPVWDSGRVLCKLSSSGGHWRWM